MDIILNELIRLDIDLRFHTPNALHVREITPDMAQLLHASGFRTIRLGFETSDINSIMIWTERFLRESLKMQCEI